LYKVSKQKRIGQENPCRRYFSSTGKATEKAHQKNDVLIDALSEK
jgi:hypothetical protein